MNNTGRALIALPFILAIAALIALVSHLVVALVVEMPAAGPRLGNIDFWMQGIVLLLAAFGLLVAALSVAAWLLTGRIPLSRIAMRQAWANLLLGIERSDRNARHRLLLLSLPALVLPLGAILGIAILGVSTAYALVSSGTLFMRLILATALLLELGAFLVIVYAVISYLHWIITGRWISSRRELFRWR
jgi:hypothetical protein